MTRFRHLFFVLALVCSAPVFSQCFQIESILVDACGPQEGLNEMVRFKIGGAAVNTSALSVTWPNNPWQGLIQNATTAQKVATLNADILDAGGCGQLIEPVGGVLPANATVILVSSYQMDTASNQFGPIAGDIYILFQDNPSTTSGHFANFGAGLRTLVMSFGSCSDTVIYDRSLLIDQNGVNTAGDGAMVLFATDGTPTYVNYGCTAAVPPFTADAGPETIDVCTGATVSLNGTALGQTSVQWSAASGTFSDAASPHTDYTLPPGASGSITLTLTATNACGATVSDNITLTILPNVIPDFPASQTICSGSAPPVLANVSPNGVSGTWTPATVSNTASGAYVFTPNVGQCASPVTFSVTVTPAIVPNFATSQTICAGSAAPTLPATSPNGIAGTWSPATVSNTASGNYVFTPNAGQCALPVTFAVTVTNSITPDFPTQLSLCQNSTAPLLSTTSPNGITGLWNPSTVSNTASGIYVFTPNAGQCAVPVTLSVTVTNSITPDFATQLSLCQNSTVPLLSTTSPNGITGSWNPSTISNTASGVYVFTPDAGQCAVPVTLSVTATNSITPDFATQLTLCQNSTAPLLNTTSPNGITGSWNPSAISNTASGVYVFTPNAGQCALPVTLSVTVTNSITPDFPAQLNVCLGQTPPVLALTSPNGITGTWNPPAIDNVTGGVHFFTPDPGQCASPAVLLVNINTAVTPDFPSELHFCNGAAVPGLATVSPNGISGTWNPPAIDDQNNGTYVFTPDAGQCATPFTLTTTVDNISVSVTQGCQDGFYILHAESAGAQGVLFAWKDMAGTVLGTTADLDLTTAANTYGLDFPLSVTLEVSAESGCSITEAVAVPGILCTIQKGISPNGDGLNDSFDLTGFNVRELKIYNRYGTQVYAHSDYADQWHGQTDKGQELPDGTYYYALTMPDGATRTGWIYILRKA